MSQKKKYGKLKGFTTVELSLVMLLAGLISSLAYGSYTFLVKQFYGYSKNTIEMMETRQCLNLVKKDIRTCRWLYANDDMLECVGEKLTILYDFSHGNHIIRTQMQRSDTFRLCVREKNFGWMKKPAGTGKTIIDEVILTTDFKGSNSEIRFKKQYSNQDLMILHSAHGH